MRNAKVAGVANEGFRHIFECPVRFFCDTNYMVPQIIYKRFDDGFECSPFVVRNQTIYIFQKQCKWSGSPNNVGDMKKNLALFFVLKSFLQPDPAECLAGESGQKHSIFRVFHLLFKFIAGQIVFGIVPI